MGFFDTESAAERSARIRGENQQRNRQASESRYDREKQDKAEADWERRNWDNKKLTFTAEQKLAAREGREPRFDSPEDVPDIGGYPFKITHTPQPKAESDDLGPLPFIAIIVIIVFFVLPRIFEAVFGAIGGALSIVFGIIFLAMNIILWALAIGAVVLTIVWLIKRHKAAGDPDLAKAARMWNPWNVARASAGVAKDMITERRGKKQAGPQ